MALIPSVKVTTGATLQRSYFTSELFVTAAREDVERLLSTFDHLVEDEVTPFTIFKQAWIKEGWNYAHLYIWEATARREYFLTMFRIFLEHMNEEEDEVLQIGAVFALYTLYEMQMKSEALQRVEHIPICIDTLEYLCSVAQNCDTTFKPYLVLILRQLMNKDVFHILPSSHLKPYNPTRLPHSFIIRKDDETLKDIKGTGKTKAERERAGRAKWHLLNTWVDERASTSIAGLENVSSTPNTDSLISVVPTRHGDEYEYEQAKNDVLGIVSDEVEKTAERNALARLKALSTAETGSASSEGIERFENMLENGAGILRNQWSSAGATESRIESSSQNSSQ